MKLKIYHRKEETILSFDKDKIVIGKAKTCDLQLKGWFIAETHASIKKISSGYIVEDLNRGANGTIVNSRKIDLYGPLNINEDLININGYVIKILEDEKENSPLKIINPEVSEKINFEEVSENSQAKVLNNGQLSKITKISPCYKKLEYEWMSILRLALIGKMDLRRKDINQMSKEELREETLTCLEQILYEKEQDIPIILDLNILKKKIIDEVIGLGPLDDLLLDNTITEIMVNARDEIYVEKSGRIIKIELEFTNEKAILDVIERIVTPLGRRIDESSPMVDARLPDGSRVNAIIPPLAIKGPTITIRKFPTKRIEVNDLIKYTSLNDDMANFLKVCVEHKKNIVISGGTGSGKTTLLNVLTSFIPKGERVITIEDAAELKLSHDHLISLEARPGNSEGKGIIHIRDLVKNSLRMRPDRIVIGECRGAEALDMLQAMNTGHEGSLTTLHANTPRDAISRLETMIMMTGVDLPLNAIREQIASAVDVIIQQSRLSCGSRKVTHITEVVGIESGKIQLQDIYKFEKTGMGIESKITEGNYKASGFIPSFFQELKDAGVSLDISKFQSEGT